MDAEAHGTRAAMAHIGEAMSVDPSEFEDARRLARRIGDFLGRA